MNMRSKAHRPRIENARIHLFEVARNPRSEAHVRNDVALGVEAGRDLDQLQPVSSDPEDRALCDEKGHLTALASNLCAVADLLELRNELLMATFLADDSLALLPA